MPDERDESPEFPLEGQTPAEGRLDRLVAGDEAQRAKRVLFEAIAQGDTQAALAAMTTLEQHMGFNAHIVRGPQLLNAIEAAHETENEKLEAALKLRRDMAWEQSEAARGQDRVGPD